MLNTGTYLDYNDHTDAIESIYKSPWEFLGNASARKNFQAIQVFGVDGLDREYTVDIATEGNFTQDNTLAQCSVTFGAGGYGSSAYGSEAYGDPSISALRHKLSNGRLYSFRVILSNDEIQKNISITGYALEIAAPYKPAMKT